MRTAAGFGRGTVGDVAGVTRAVRIGASGAAEVPVFFCSPRDAASLVEVAEGIACAERGPFILTTPTAAAFSVRVEQMEAKDSFLLLPLSHWLRLAGPGRLEMIRPLDSVLQGFERRVAQAQNIAPLLEGIHREIVASRDERRDLSAAKAGLAKMHGEGMFAFARHIDREAREEFLAIMAGGDVAKAARELGMKDSTLRSKLAMWAKRGKAYAALAEIVRWRKSIKGQAGMDFAKRVASGGERDVDFPALIRDTVAELEEMAPGNWEERCADLADALRRAVS